MTHSASFQVVFRQFAKPLAAIVAVTGYALDPDALDPDLFTEHVRHAAACLRLFPDHKLADYAAGLDRAVDCLTVAVYEPDPTFCSQLVHESRHWLNALYFAAGILGVL